MKKINLVCLLGSWAAISLGDTVSYDAGAALDPGNWNNPLNWSTDALPGAADDVQLIGPASSVTNTDGAVSIHSLLLKKEAWLSTEFLTVADFVKILPNYGREIYVTLNNGAAIGGDLLCAPLSGQGTWQLNVKAGPAVSVGGSLELESDAAHSGRLLLYNNVGVAGNMTLTDTADDEGYTELAFQKWTVAVTVGGSASIDGRLTVNRTAYSGEDAQFPLIHVTSASALAGEFDNVVFGETTLTNAGDFVYRFDLAALDADGVSNDVVLNRVESPFAVHSLFHDHMVLQRDANAPIWGWAAPGASVSLLLDEVSVTNAVADASSGEWMVPLPPQAADGGVSHTLRITSSGEEDILVSDVVFGDVYLASGQSNMRRPMIYITGYEAEAAASDYPLIRQVEIAMTNSVAEWAEPEFMFPWSKSHPDVIGGFSSTAYFFQRTLFRETGVPVGVIVAAYGGQNIERFLSPDGVTAVPDLAGVMQDQEQGGLEDADFYGLYNAMIAPLSPYAIRGVIWYQGEANSNDGDLYRYYLQALMRGWRQKWGGEDFPFYLAQLANYDTSSSWQVLREAQRGALSETNTGMAVLIDIGDEGNIHPGNKQDVGWRLAQWALAKDLNSSRVYSGPLFLEAQVEGSALRILFDYADGGLIIGRKDGTNALVEVTDGALENFMIAGADREYVDAEAVIDSDTVLVSSESVPDPVYVRYCYANAPAGTNKLYNAAGLPASPFHTDLKFHLRARAGEDVEYYLLPGFRKEISAGTAPDGQVFDRWIGSAGDLDDPTAATTTVTMPDHSLYLLATWRATNAPVYTLTVSSGAGGGTSQAGALRTLCADEPPDGQVFDHWAGDTNELADVSSAETTLRMPEADVSVTAVCRTVDSVGDGLADSWRDAYLPAGGAESAADADPDRDGFSNLQEYVAGTSPLDGDSVVRLDGLAVSESQIGVAFSSQPGTRYRLESSASLSPADWQPLIYNITGDGFQKQFSLNLEDANAGFVRVQVSGE